MSEVECKVAFLKMGNILRFLLFFLSRSIQSGAIGATFCFAADLNNIFLGNSSLNDISFAE